MMFETITSRLCRTIELLLHSDEGLTSETSVSDTPDFHGVQLSSQIPIYSIAD